MKKNMYVGIMLGIFLGGQAHGMLRRSALRVTPPVATAAEYVAPEMLPNVTGRVTQGVGAASKGFTSKLVAAGAQKESYGKAFRNAFEESRARMAAAMRGLKAPVAAATVGAAGGAVGVMMYDDPGVMRQAESQMFALQQMFPVVGDARQESIWRSMFDAAYAQWLNGLDRKLLEQEYKDVVEQSLQLEDIIFRRELLRKFQQQGHKRFWESADSYNNRTKRLLDEEVQAVKVHGQKQADARAELDKLWYITRSQLVNALREIKPDVLLKKHADQESERIHKAHFSGMRKTVADIIKP